MHWAGSDGRCWDRTGVVIWGKPEVGGSPPEGQDFQRLSGFVAPVVGFSAGGDTSGRLFPVPPGWVLPAALGAWPWLSLGAWTGPDVSPSSFPGWVSESGEEIQLRSHLSFQRITGLLGLNTLTPTYACPLPALPSYQGCDHPVVWPGWWAGGWVPGEGF